jgi:putative transposase
MKKRFTEEQIVKALTRIKNGMMSKDLAREMGINIQTLYHWKKKYGDLTISEAKKMRELEMENSKLKRIVADQALDIAMLKEVNSKKW